jgi:threonine dehydratase
MDMKPDMVQTANQLRQLVRPTTIIRSDKLDALVGTEVVLASETFQCTGSFKFRAAYNVARHSHKAELIAASSGNFGQALAYACKLLGKKCTIVMPENSASVKIQAIKDYGGIVDLVNVKHKTRAQRVLELAQEHPDSAVVSAFDDEWVIAGNATLGQELADLSHQFDSIVVPIGGGGLISGIIRGLKSKGCALPIWGAEPEMANDAARSLRAGALVRNETEPQTIADGVRTLSLGDHNWPIIRDGVAGIIEVPENLIIEAVKALFFQANLKVEATGALTLAAVLTDKQRWHGQRVCCIVSGGNVDADVLLKLLAAETL